MSIQRWPIVVVAVGLLAGAVAFGGEPAANGPEPLGGAGAAEAVATVAGEDALTSTWFCAGGTTVPDGPFDHTVLVTNLSDEAIDATVEAIGSEGQTELVEIEVGAGSTTPVRLGDIVEAPWAGASVEVAGGNIVVEHRIEGPAGRDQSRCTPNPSDTWHFAYGRTALGSRMWLAILNPFPDRAVADITFDTDDGFRNPTDLNGLLIPGRSVRIIEVGNHAQRHQLVSADVNLRSGRVVVDRVQLLGLEDGTQLGLDLELGATEPATAWYFAEGRVGPTMSEIIVVSNPSDERATVDVVIRPSAGSAAGPIEPFEVAIAPRSRQEIVVDNETRVPKPLEHATIVQSFNGVPVVVERVVIGGAPELVAGGDEVVEDGAEPVEGSEEPVEDSDATSTDPDATPEDTDGADDGTAGEESALAPAVESQAAPTQTAPLRGSGPGFSAQMGSPVASTDQIAIVPTGQDVWLSLLNPGGEAVEVDIGLLNANGEQQLLGEAVTVEAADRREVSVDLPDASDPAIVVVRADTPVVVDQGVVWSDAVGTADLGNEPLIPRAGTTSVPDSSGLTAPVVATPAG
ncbi:MAG: hypothetical protein S0880_16905 [Actinomycetota bacterium]|nr:hypothetical protein [Actinomycetota bacterium]